MLYLGTLEQKPHHLTWCKYVIEEPLIYKGLHEGFPRYKKITNSVLINKNSI